MIVAPEPHHELPRSILDQDLYKFLMQHAVREHYPDVHVQYMFINRDKGQRLNEPAFRWLQQRIIEREYLETTCCPFLPKRYFDYLSQFRFDPENQVSMEFSDCDKDSLRLTVSGRWADVILYEIPLLSLISEAYFKFVDTDWNYDGQMSKAREKGMYLIRGGCSFAEFGTRRRRDFHTQYLVIKSLLGLPPGRGRLVGTSNVYLARHFDIPASGTVGHEWTMGIAAIEGTYENGNSLALRKWHDTFGGHLGIALTDTFGSKAFFANFDHDLATKYRGVRHDSGDPFEFIETVKRHYQGLGIDPTSKIIVFSDGLNPETAVRLQSACQDAGVGCSFGIGTNFTNDFVARSDPARTSLAMNIVIKLVKCNDKFCVKLSDVKTKHTGDPQEVLRAQYELGMYNVLERVFESVDSRYQ
ncbi:nicotinate phosphoribosyltransferase [Spiromyces aspiralis]|uniref:Nicotinate phosphoribosyltransferase n=1 Tax=Spiromyces aspiralis TaxID=68401 RepID=A0ACC1HJ75_9FUNG|nr:nicotinate phosphoribosyltransferase [Spiromyces aspiralis]